MSRAGALVTGAARGIGRAIATALARGGFDVAVNDREDSAELAACVAELRALGAKAGAVVGDIADTGGHERLLDAAEAQVGPLAVLVNNAGVPALRRGDLLDVSAESYDRCQAVNARGMFFLSQAFARRLLGRDRDPAQHHCIINVTSSNATAAAVGRGEYCVSKSAASMVSQLFAVRLGAENIAVYEIQPGIIETEMTAPVLDDYRARIEAGLTLTPRSGTPEDVGRAAAVLASGGLGYSTGQAIQVDGGLLVSRF
jgi:NAD(P)-dependent dehydrogenase (short-subunit alcohol dehydrogenase family)